MRKTTAFIIVAVAIILALGLSTRKKQFVWSMEQSTPKGHQPYDMALFDELLQRSLPSGYEVRPLNTEFDEVSTQEEVDKMAETEPVKKKYLCGYPVSTDVLGDPRTENILVVQKYDWVYDGEIAADLLNYVMQGGNVVLVTGKSDATGGFLNALLANVDEGAYNNYYELSSYGPSTLTPVYYKNSPDTFVTINESTQVNGRFASADFNRDSHPYCRDDADAGMRRFAKQLKVRSIMSDKSHIYGIDIYRQGKKGHLYVVSLVEYFTNLGVMLPEGPGVIACALSNIDKRKVVRIEYPYIVPNSASQPTKNDSMMAIAKTPALALAWKLVLLMAFLLLVRGLYRRLPATPGAERELLDETDPVAVREYRFRHSPLLHFIFQYSWLYRGRHDYRSLFEINFRRMARYVAHHTSVELASADKEQLKLAANVLASRHSMPASEVLDDLAWMQGFMTGDGNITANVFKYSQTITEKYI